jgi:hypothetical protein
MSNALNYMDANAYLGVGCVMAAKISSLGISCLGCTSFCNRWSFSICT